MGLSGVLNIDILSIHENVQNNDSFNPYARGIKIDVFTILNYTSAETTNIEWYPGRISSMVHIQIQSESVIISYEDKISENIFSRK